MITAMPRIAIAVHDFAAAIATFRDKFGMPVVDFSDSTVPGLGAHVAMCQPEGGSNVELMAAADAAAPLSQSLLKFLDRRGEGLFALMLEAPDPNAEAVVLAERDLAVLPLMAGAGGRDVHPRSTHGVLVRVYPDNSARNDGGNVSLAPYLSGIAKVIIATTDAAAASRAYGHGFGLATDAPCVDDERGVSVVHCHPPKGGVIELVSPCDLTRNFAQQIRGFLSTRGEGMYALVLRADDPNAAASMLESRGIAVEAADGSGSTPALTAFGARFLLEAAQPIHRAGAILAQGADSAR